MEKKKVGNIDDFLCLLNGVKQLKNGQYVALCPAHSDRNPSLSMRQNKDKILIHCQAGCSTEAILKAMSLDISDLFLEVTKSQIVAIYRYQDANGKPLFEVVRYEPKGFSQRQPDGRGGYIGNVNGITPVLYHLPDILQAIQNGDTIYLTEGEKDCDRLWQLGLVATTNPMGAKKWKVDYTKTLYGAKKVVVCADSDQAGLEHAKTICETLEGKVEKLLVWVPPMGCNDVSDWLEQGHSIETLEDGLVPPNVLSIYTLSKGSSSRLAAHKDAQRTHKFGIEDVREYVRGQGFRYWETRSLDYELGISTPEERHYRRRLCDLMESKDEIEKHPTDGKKYRQISQEDILDYKAVSQGKPLNLWLPFDLHNHFVAYPGNLLDFAGATDVGKTALAVNIIKNNDDRWQIDYWTNEFSAEELNAKMLSVAPNKPMEDWNFMAKVIKPGYLNKIRPNILSIFDYIDVGDPWYRIAEEQQAIHEAIGKGLAIIFIQKDDYQKLGRGKGFSTQLPRLYIVLTKNTAYAYKAKTPKDSDNPLKGKTCDFSLKNGVNFTYGEWRFKEW